VYTGPVGSKDFIPYVKSYDILQVATSLGPQLETSKIKARLHLQDDERIHNQIVDVKTFTVNKIETYYLITYKTIFKNTSGQVEVTNFAVLDLKIEQIVFTKLLNFD
jgi:hypothetical protein